MNKKVEVLIYKPTKNAMQSGYVSKDHWELKYLHTSKVKLDSLMGWSGSNDTKKQITLKFETLKDAINYAERNSISYKVISEQKRNIKPKSYAANFSFNRKGMWTH